MAFCERARLPLKDGALVVVVLPLARAKLDADPLASLASMAEFVARQPPICISESAPNIAFLLERLRTSLRPDQHSRLLFCQQHPDPLQFISLELRVAASARLPGPPPSPGKMQSAESNAPSPKKPRLADKLALAAAAARAAQTAELGAGKQERTESRPPHQELASAAPSPSIIGVDARKKRSDAPSPESPREEKRPRAEAEPADPAVCPARLALVLVSNARRWPRQQGRPRPAPVRAFWCETSGPSTDSERAEPPTPTSRRRVYVVELKPGVQGFRLVSTRWETTRFGKQVRYATDDSENNLKTCLFPEDCTLKIWWKKKGQEELELLKSDKEWPEELWQGGTLVLEPKPKKAT